MDQNDAGRIVAVVDRRIEKKTRVGATIETTWGEVCGLSADGKYASAYLYGETDVASEDFRVPSDLALNIGDKVKVAWDGRGERWVFDVAVDSDYPKIAVNPNTGELLTGDGTVPPTAFDLEGHDHDAFDGSTVDTTGDVTVGGNLVIPTGNIEMENGLTFEPGGQSGAEQVLVRRTAGVGGSTFLTITGDEVGYSRQILFKEEEADTQPGLKIGWSSTDEAEILFGEGGTTLPDVRLYRAGADELKLDTGDFLSGQFVGRQVQRTSTQTVSNVATWTKATGLGATLTRIGASLTDDCIEVLEEGDYLVTISLRWVNCAVDKRYGCGYSIGASSDPGSATPDNRAIHLYSASEASNHYQTAVWVASLDAGNFITAQVWQGNSASQTFDNIRFGIFRLGTVT